MDEFVRNTLTEWGFSNLIDRFQEEEIDKESLYCLGEHDIDQLIPKAGPKARFKKRLKELKSQQVCEEAIDLGQVLPSTSNICGKGKRNLLPEKGSPPKVKRLCDSKPGSVLDDLILSDVKSIMKSVHDRLSHQNSTLNAFLRNKIDELQTDKREVVGVFGQTGAGKSSLINAVIGEKDLLPTGDFTACTTVMIKVEANMLSKKYEAEIEFIPKEEWKDELWSMINLYKDNEDEENDDDEYNDNKEKLTALYGDDWESRSHDLMELKCLKEIPEFLQSKKKILYCESAKDLSAKMEKYTRSGSEEPRRCYWPLVKSVTVRVPDNKLLQHVTLVDLPGNGDCNKSRDQMWRQIVGSCSTVWIVSGMTRAASDGDAWEILESTCGVMGNGGECQNIHFICTKSDSLNGADCPAADVSRNILKNNVRAKKLVRTKFNTLKRVKKHFKDDCFKVFTVSSKEFLKPKHLKPDETEIPILQEFLQSLNDQHDQTLNHVSGAYGILSLMKGASCGNVKHQQTWQVCAKLNENIEHEVQKVQKSMEDVCKEFENCLKKGVELSRDSCEISLRKKLKPRKGGRGFHRTLKCLVQNNGNYKPNKKNKSEINLNETLSACLTDSIDEEFRKTFPNDRKLGPFYGAIHTFSLDTESLIQQYSNHELQLIFMKTEEEKVKTSLCKMICDGKKKIYNSLTETVVEEMQECYRKAAEFRGKGTLVNMRQTVERHVHDVKDTMFDHAKDVMLAKLKELIANVLEKIWTTLQNSVELSFNTDDEPIPDITAELSLVTKHYKELMGPDDKAFSRSDTSSSSMGE